MYFHWSIKKLSVVAALILFLFGSIYATFETKSSRYGATTFSQVGGRILSDAYHTVEYAIRIALINDDLFAAPIAAVYEYEADENSTERAEAVPVLVYHTIVSDPDRDNVLRKNFEEQMLALKQAGWDTITLEEFEAFMDGELDLPEKSFLITFDDGARASYYPVDPLLRALGYNATMYILAAFSLGEGTNYYLSHGEISRMLKSGRWEIGSHGNNVHHFVPIDNTGLEGAALANRIWIEEKNRLETAGEYKKRIQDDLTSARTLISDTYNVPITTFAFPFGDFGQLSLNNEEADDVIREIAAEVYDRSFYQYWKGDGFSFNYPSANSSFGKRITVDPAWGAEELLSILERGTPKPLPYQETFVEKGIGNDWVPIWGTYRIEDSVLTIGATPDTSGASMVLDGSAHWENYRVRMDVESPQGTGLSIWMRFRDDNHNASCNFGKNFVHIEQVVDGEHRVIKGVRNEDIIPEGVFSVDATVSGREMTCSINDEVLVSTAFLDETLTEGGVGIKVWDEELGKSTLAIYDIAITP
jgi:peptidoglycan/xylan/chitin deacetylase (PgdA/CDA1 family)